jgi:hypothetical protein
MKIPQKMGKKNKEEHPSVLRGTATSLLRYKENMGNFSRKGDL